MQTKQQWLLDFIEQPNAQFTIPAYQRVYSWFESQCEELWEDVMRCGKEEVSHFMSMTLFLDAGIAQNGMRRLDIIDGQQRIATTVIMLTALRDYLRETGSVLKTDALANQPGDDTPEELDADGLHDRYLVVNGSTGAEAKINLSNRDKTTLSSLIFETAMPERVSVRTKENYDYFLRRMHEDGFDVQVFWCGIRELLIIAAELGENDKAQTIFEGLNTKGLPLTAADLMRNYLLVGKTREEQQRLYTEYWQPMEIMFEDDLLSSGSLKLNTGLRMWLAIRYRRMHISDRARTYYYFKQFMETEYDGTFEELLDEMRSFCYLWSANYECIGGRTHCSRFDWAKKGRKTLVPPMERAADVRANLRVSREQKLLEQMERGRQRKAEKAASQEPATLDFQTSPAGYETVALGQWGDEPIQWRVLERSADQALLISERIIDCAPYHHHYVATTWAGCFLRQWANGDFYEGAFTDGEAARLVTNTTHTPDDELWETIGGPDSEDHVWLLSTDEARQYFPAGPDRMARPTEFAHQQGISIEKGYSLWWLRSPGHGQAFAATVWPVGGVDTAGSGVGRPGVGFRPVIRVRL